MPSAGRAMKTIWVNQWEPLGIDAKQFARRCHGARLGGGFCVNKDIEFVLDCFEVGELALGLRHVLRPEGPYGLVPFDAFALGLEDPFKEAFSRV